MTHLIIWLEFADGRKLAAPITDNAGGLDVDMSTLVKATAQYRSDHGEIQTEIKLRESN